MRWPSFLPIQPLPPLPPPQPDPCWRSEYAITAIGPESWPLNKANGNQTFLNWYWNQDKTWSPAKYDPDQWIACAPLPAPLLPPHHHPQGAQALGFLPSGSGLTSAWRAQ